MELIEIVTAVVIGALLTLIMMGIYVWVLCRRIKRRVDRMVKEIIAEAEVALVGLDIELDNGVYFCYNSKDKQFVCQGSTIAEIREAFGARFPDKTAYLAGGDPAVVEEFKTELLKLAINENSSSQ